MSERRRKMIVLSSAEDDAIQERAAALGLSWGEYARRLIQAGLVADGVTIPYVEVEQRRRHAQNMLAIHVVTHV